MSKMNQSNLSFDIKLESKDFTSQDSEWQEECHKFYLQLKNTLNEGTIEPHKVKSEGEGYRDGGLLSDWSHLAISLPLLATEITLLTLHIRHFLERKKGAEMILKIAGKEIKIPNAQVAESDIEDLIRKGMIASKDEK